MHDKAQDVADLKEADAHFAAAAFAVGLCDIGGVAVKSDAGPQWELWLKGLKALLPKNLPARRLPSNTTDDRLLGGLDLAATLSAGRPVADRGLLAECHGGMLIVPGAERLAAPLAGRICNVLDLQEVVTERDGLARRHPAQVGILCLDEGNDGDSNPPVGLLDRLAIRIDLHDLRLSKSCNGAVSANDVANARMKYRSVHLSDSIRAALCETAVALGIASLNAPILASRVARIAAALRNQQHVSEEDAALAVRLVLVPRATCLPEVELEQSRPDETPSQPPTDSPSRETQPALTDVLVAAAKAALPPNLLAELNSAPAGRSRAAASGKAGLKQKSPRRGRPVGIARSTGRQRQRLNIIETLRAAAPWQALRRIERHQEALKTAAPLVDVRADDFRVRRLKHKGETVTIFVVDASGSTAVQRLAEAKGAVELLLADCYSRRDYVALIAVGGRSADVLLPPTRALARARRSLSDLPGGGGTPLASGLMTAFELSETAKLKGQKPGVVVLTDGRANICRDGKAERPRAGSEALAAASDLRASGVATLLIDVSPKPRPEGARIAEAMAATYVPMPHADALALSETVKSQMGRRPS